MGSKGTWLVQNPGGKKPQLCWTARENICLRLETKFWRALLFKELELCLFVGGTTLKLLMDGLGLIR